MTSPAPATQPSRWRVLAGAIACLMLTGTFYAFSVIAQPLATERGWALPDVMFAFGVASVMVPLSMLATGVLLDRGAAQPLVVVGGVLFGLANIGLGLAPTVLLAQLSYGVVGGFGQGVVYSAALSNTLKFFPDKRGLASGLVSSGLGVGTIISAPLIHALLVAAGVRNGLIVLGVVLALGIAASGIALIRHCPVDYRVPGLVTGQASRAPDAQRHYRATQMLATPQFWLIIATYVCGTFFGLMITSNVSAIGVTMFGLGGGVAALFVSLLALANASGRLIWGPVSDRIGSVRALMACFVLAAAALLTLSFVSGTTGFAVGVLAVGFAYGGVMAIVPPFTMANFGARHQGINFSIMFSAFALGGLVAPRLAAQIAASNAGSYSIAFQIAAVLALMGVLLAFGYRLVNARRPLQVAAGAGAHPAPRPEA